MNNIHNEDLLFQCYIETNDGCLIGEIYVTSVPKIYVVMEMNFQSNIKKLCAMTKNFVSFIISKRYSKNHQVFANLQCTMRSHDRNPFGKIGESVLLCSGRIGAWSVYLTKTKSKYIGLRVFIYTLWDMEILVYDWGFDMQLIKYERIHPLTFFSLLSNIAFLYFHYLTFIICFIVLSQFPDLN